MLKSLKNPIFYAIKVMFYLSVVFLVIFNVHSSNSPNHKLKKPKVKNTHHIREPTVQINNDGKDLIIAEKKRYVVNVPKRLNRKKVKARSKYRKINVVATSYIANCSEGCTGVTATGINVENNNTHEGMVIIATDPSVIPLHSIVEVKSKNENFKAIAEDTGGGINGFEIDVLSKTRREAVDFGRQCVTLTILREGKG